MSELTKQADRPVDFFSQMRREMDTLFNRWFTRQPFSGVVTWPTAEGLLTPCELQETDGEFVVKVDVPGMAEKDIKVTFQGDSLTIRGERKEEKTETKGTTRYSERSYGSFLRTLPMPSAVKGDEIRARYKDGVMEVHLPKAQKTTSREIKVEAGT